MPLEHGDRVVFISTANLEYKDFQSPQYGEVQSNYVDFQEYDICLVPQKEVIRAQYKHVRVCTAAEDEKVDEIVMQGADALSFQNDSSTLQQDDVPDNVYIFFCLTSSQSFVASLTEVHGDDRVLQVHNGNRVTIHKQYLMFKYNSNQRMHMDTNTVNDYNPDEARLYSKVTVVQEDPEPAECENSFMDESITEGNNGNESHEDMEVEANLSAQQIMEDSSAAAHPATPIRGPVPVPVNALDFTSPVNKGLPASHSKPRSYSDTASSDSASASSPSSQEEWKPENDQLIYCLPQENGSAVSAKSNRRQKPAPRKSVAGSSKKQASQNDDPTQDPFLRTRVALVYVDGEGYEAVFIKKFFKKTADIRFHGFTGKLSRAKMDIALLHRFEPQFELYRPLSCLNDLYEEFDKKGKFRRYSLEEYNKVFDEYESVTGNKVPTLSRIPEPVQEIKEPSPPKKSAPKQKTAPSKPKKSSPAPQRKKSSPSSSPAPNEADPVSFQFPHSQDHCPFSRTRIAIYPCWAENGETEYHAVLITKVLWKRKKFAIRYYGFPSRYEVSRDTLLPYESKYELKNKISSLKEVYDYHDSSMKLKRYTLEQYDALFDQYDKTQTLPSQEEEDQWFESKGISAAQMEEKLASQILAPRRAAVQNKYSTAKKSKEKKEKKKKKNKAKTTEKKQAPSKPQKKAASEPLRSISIKDAPSAKPNRLREERLHEETLKKQQSSPTMSSKKRKRSDIDSLGFLSPALEAKKYFLKKEGEQLKDVRSRKRRRIVNSKHSPVSGMRL